MKNRKSLYIIAFSFLTIIVVFYNVAIRLPSEFTEGWYILGISEKPQKKIQSEENRQLVNDKWLQELSKVSEKKFHFPAQQIQLRWDLVEPDFRSEVAFSLIFDDMDKYKYFCLEQILNSHNILRTAVQNDNNLKVYLNVNKKEVVDNLIIELKKYDIFGKYEEELKPLPYN